MRRLTIAHGCGAVEGVGDPGKETGHGLSSRSPATKSRALFVVVCTAILAGCVSTDIPQNFSPDLYSPEKSSSTGNGREELTFTNNACPPAGTTKFIAAGLRNTILPDTRDTAWRRLPPMRYSPGDRFNLLIHDAPEFSGDYAINVDGTVVLPYAGQIQAVGLTNAQLMERIEAALIDNDVFTEEASRISVRPVQYAQINVTVSGAVFNPGRHSINTIRDSDKLEKVLTKFGDSPLNRFVPAALRAAGGIRPDADLSNVKVQRNGKVFTLDWRGAITGHPVDDIPLIEGDHVQVGEAECFQSALVRPSQITPEAVRVFSSNLTVPAQNNAASLGNPRQAGGVPYGTRLLQGLVQANCVGGTYTTNASRYAVLISRNPKTRETEVIQRSIEELVRSANRDAINPFLMPDDAIACYDSAVTEFRDVMSVFQGALSPADTARSAF